MSARPTLLGATFVPGGSDDFYMPPEVISPAPQRLIGSFNLDRQMKAKIIEANETDRVTPELPTNIQDNLARLELDAAPTNRLSGLQSPPPPGSIHGVNSFPSRSSSMYSSATAFDSPPTPKPHDPQTEDTSDQPSFSPFPPLRKRPANVPPSDHEKEAILEKARMPVLNANDPEMQLTWAQDTLAYVEIASQNEIRISESQTARPRTPRIEHQLRVDAISIVSFLADQHHPKAEFLRGMWLEFGKFGFRMDKKEAFRCFQRAAQRGFARAEYRMGMQFENSMEIDKALRHYNMGVQKGDSASNYRLGMMSLLGQHGQPLDYAKGIKLISYAAEIADENAPQGAYVFGMLQARDLPQINLPESCLSLSVSGARFNIEKAAYLGFAKAQTKMGSAYELCQLGCDFDPALSLHYNALAAKQGESDADMAISKWFLCGYEGVFEKNEELAFTYAQRAASAGLATGEFAMGYFYEVGIYTAVDMEKSRSWYQKAAAHGNKDAVARIDSISRSKTLSRNDHESVAIAKIQSQYGSHRGQRPDRFKGNSTPMPTIKDESGPINMPEPEVIQARPHDNRPTPYPPKAVPSVRAPSVAPYPLDDERTPNVPRPSNQSQQFQQSARPSVPATPFGGPRYKDPTLPTLITPQHHSQGPRPVSAGRVGPIAHNAQQSPPRRPSAGYVSPVRHPGSPVAPPQLPPTAPQLPPIDIGFSAPPDFSGADRPQRQQKLPTQPSARPPPGAAHRNAHQHSPPERQPNMASNQQPLQTLPPNGHRNQSPTRKSVSAGRPGLPVPTPQASGPQTGHKTTGPSRPNPDGHAAITPATVSAARPHGTGPQTFQEMGVPLPKQENDCTIM